MSQIPHLLTADAQGNIIEEEGLLMLCNRAGKWHTPRPEELTPLPPESELFLLPGRRAAGFRHGKIHKSANLAVAAFAAPGYTIGAHPAYFEDVGAPVLPLFAYGAVGYARGRYWINATRVDLDKRQRFDRIRPGRIEKEAAALLNRYGRNRLVRHIINNCVRRYGCPAARNFALGRYEAPLPTSRACNARCLGCISLPSPDSPLSATPQCRLDFTPLPEEIAEVMKIHEAREKKSPIYSFGQGCEGDPLANKALLCESIRLFRACNGVGTINCNTNASDPEAVEALGRAGLTSMRVSLNSAQPHIYEAYYRPQNYSFKQVQESIRIARRLGIHTSLNLLYFPGLSDNHEEIAAIVRLCRQGVSMIQMRNLNIDPLWYLRQMGDIYGDQKNRTTNLREFMQELKNQCPWLTFGYFNPYLGERAKITAPMPD